MLTRNLGLRTSLNRGFNTTLTSCLKRRSFARPYSSGSGNSGNRARLIAIGGLLGAGLVLYSMNHTGGTPMAYVEPQLEDFAQKRAFTQDQVSVIFVLGGPGAGKGTQCANLVRDYGFVHLSAGDLLRAEQAREGSKYGEMIAQYIKDGLIVPQEVTIALLEQAMNEGVKLGKSKFLIDGFPRKMDQLLTFEKQVALSSFTLFFDCPESVMLERLLERGKTSGRTDDNVESIKKRFKTFVETSMPVVEYFEEKDKVVKVKCDSPVDQVYNDVKVALKNRLNL